ncbi:MAG TPA: DUF5674 family protein [Candidatus Saccharimonadales bacterium]|nr:DUF5674 family protein [Candidatus Saccharimonadales bacterium]
MIITKNTPFTKNEIKDLRECFDVYIKTVIDVERSVCSAGCDRHFESEKKLLESGSNQNNLWGGGIDLETLIVDFNSFINIRPKQDNNSNEILDSKTRDKFEKISKYFFGVLYEK